MKLGFRQIVKFGDPDMLRATLEKLFSKPPSIDIVRRFYESHSAQLFCKVSNGEAKKLTRGGDIWDMYSWPAGIAGDYMLFVHDKRKVTIYVDKGEANGGAAILEPSCS